MHDVGPVRPTVIIPWETFPQKGVRIAVLYAGAAALAVRSGRRGG